MLLSGNVNIPRLKSVIVTISGSNFYEVTDITNVTNPQEGLNDKTHSLPNRVNHGL